MPDNNPFINRLRAVISSSSSSSPAILDAHQKVSAYIQALSDEVIAQYAEMKGIDPTKITQADRKDFEEGLRSAYLVTAILELPKASIASQNRDELGEQMQKQLSHHENSRNERELHVGATYDAGPPRGGVTHTIDNGLIQRAQEALAHRGMVDPIQDVLSVVIPNDAEFAKAKTMFEKEVKGTNDRIEAERQRQETGQVRETYAATDPSTGELVTTREARKDLVTRESVFIELNGVDDRNKEVAQSTIGVGNARDGLATIVLTPLKDPTKYHIQAGGQDHEIAASAAIAIENAEKRILYEGGKRAEDIKFSPEDAKAFKQLFEKLIEYGKDGYNTAEEKDIENLAKHIAKPATTKSTSGPDR